MAEKITVEATIHAPIEKVWDSFTDPGQITKWNAASDDWHTPHAENNLRVGGTFTYRMEARDGSAGFDFGGTYTAVEANGRISYTMDDGRTVTTTFDEVGDETRVTTTFDAENENPVEFQRDGWQAILNNFKTYVEHAS